MVKRRSLSDGLKKSTKVDPDKEREFVFGTKADSQEPPLKRSKAKLEVTVSPATPDPIPETFSEQPAGQPLGRSALTSKIRSDLGDALKRASLERQLAKQTPWAIQEILDLVLEPWLKENGYLK